MQTEVSDNSLNFGVDIALVEKCVYYAASARELFLQLTSEEQLMVLDYLKETSCNR